jgi:hypothetical protein
MTDENEQSIPSRGSQPVAWGNADDDGIYAVGPTEAHAHYVWERAASGKFRHRNPRIVPLYRQPQPTLTDEERQAMMRAMYRVVGADSAILWSLLERTK